MRHTIRAPTTAAPRPAPAILLALLLPLLHSPRTTGAARPALLSHLLIGRLPTTTTTTTPSPAPNPPPQPKKPECIWLDYDRNPNLTSYEFQMQPHRGMVWDFDVAAASLEALMRRLTQESRDRQPPRPAANRRWPVADANFTLVEGSRWDTVLREHAFAVSSRKGRPLHPSRFPPATPKQPFPWKRLAYLRLRRYILTLPPGAAGAPPPGSADLALKMKKVDPRLGPLQPGVSFGPGVRAKLEADVHCDHQRVSVSPLFGPVPGGLNVSRAGAKGLEPYFPGLAETVGVDPDEPLPFCHAVWRRKATWAVVYRGLVGEVGLVAKYNTTLGDAAAGRRAKNGEVALRIRREVAGAAREGESEEERLAALREAMDALAMAAQRFRDEGWDGKTPPAAGGVGEGLWREEDEEEEEEEDEVTCERAAVGSEEV